MKLPNLKRRRYKFLGIAGIVVAIAALIVFLIGDEILFKEKIIANNWEIVRDKNADGADKILALQYLAKQGESLAGVNFSGVKSTLQGLDLSPETLDIKDGVDLRNANFMYANVSNVNLSETNLTAAIFSAADLADSRLHNANLAEANLSEAKLFATNFSGAKLSAANFNKAKLLGANLIAAKLSNANLSDVELFAVNFSATDLSGVTFNEGTVIDHAWVWKTTDEQHPASYLPTGTPKNWDTTLKPAYTCPGSMSFTSQMSKEQIKKIMKKRCQPYVHRETLPTEQEAPPTEQEASPAKQEILSVPLQAPAKNKYD